MEVGQSARLPPVAAARICSQLPLRTARERARKKICLPTRCPSDSREELSKSAGGRSRSSTGPALAPDTAVTEHYKIN